MIATAPPRKRHRTTKKNKVEAAIASAFGSIMRYQMEAEEHFPKPEEEWWQRQMELEEKRQQENREHKM